MTFSAFTPFLFTLHKESKTQKAEFPGHLYSQHSQGCFRKLFRIISITSALLHTCNAKLLLRESRAMCRSFNSQKKPKGLPHAKYAIIWIGALATIRGTGDQKKSTLKIAKNPILPNHICSSLHQYISLWVFSPAVFLSCTLPTTGLHTGLNITHRISQSPYSSQQQLH